MQLTTLNRVIALFIIGAFVVTLAALGLGSDLEALAERHFEDAFGASTAVVIAIALFAITVLAGMLVDASGNLTVRWLIRFKLARRRSVAWWFFCGDEFDEQDRWRQAFANALANDVRYHGLATWELDTLKALSAGLFFRTAQKEHAEWLIQHHSMYHLAANFVLLLLAVTVWAVATGSWGWAAAMVPGAYLLLTFALDNYLYTYQLSFRNAYLALLHDAAAPEK
ncbi:MAG TPA: hypothetical protein VEK57_05285 [Thermoanaerobaculia bacterium]|nr:hypothetical protein [Thermoanaerobaculia bacterium]